MLKGVGIAAYGTAVGVPVIGIVAVGVGLLVLGGIGGYLIAGMPGLAAGTTAGVL